MNGTSTYTNGAGSLNCCVAKNGHHKMAGKSIKRESVTSFEDDGIYQVRAHETRVLVLYTGGTIGMLRDDTGALVPKPGVLAQRVRALPQMHDADYASSMLGEGTADSTLVLPDIEHHGRRIVYQIEEWDHLTDSSDMSTDDWIKIAKDIEKNYTTFDGFVVLHGTDTMSYTASALSFMLENLGKPVIVTGSQIPIFEPRSDGADNFVSALIIASTYDIPEVTLFFGNKLFRGNRTSKVSADNFDAFDSPNCEPLAVSGLALQVDSRAVFRPSAIQPFRAHTELSRDVAPIRVFPSITAAAISAYLQSPIKGVVLETYGAGNIPANRGDIHAALKKAVDRGVLIVNITQCSKGSVKPIYKTGQIVSQCGIVSGYDMTPEAALTKLSYVLSKDEWDYKTKCEMMEMSIRGELTNGKVGAMDYSVIDAVGRCVGAAGAKEAAEVSAESVLPALLAYAAVHSKPELIDTLKDFGADVCSSNFDGRSALHVAACLGEISVMEKLLHSGANVHLKDRILSGATESSPGAIDSVNVYGNTPLMDAIHCEQPEAVEMLISCGAHLGTSDLERTAMEVAAAASRGLVARLRLYKRAGADLTVADVAGRTALHVAALLGQEATVEYLLTERLSPLDEDAFGLTPVNYAKNGGHHHILSLFETEANRTV